MLPPDVSPETVARALGSPSFRPPRSPLPREIDIMGCVGSKEELQAKASSLALSAQSIGSKYFAEASELAAIYNPLQAKGDPNSR